MSAPPAEPKLSNMERTTEMAYRPQSSLQYPAPAALSRSSTSLQATTSGPFLNPAVNAARQNQYSPERTPPSAARSISRRRQGSNRNSLRHDRHEDPPIASMSDRPSSRHRQHQPHSDKYSSYDPEKAVQSGLPPSNGSRPAYNRAAYISEDEEVIEEHAVWILVYLSFFSPAVASLASIYSLFTTLLLLLFSPITVSVRPRKPLVHQFHALLAPPIYYQLRFVCSTHGSNLHGNLGPGEHRKSNPVLLTFVNILSPLYAAGIAITAWVAAGFWFTALILGDPDGRDKKDDGRTVVLGVRRLWERWLIRGLR
ncbi:MAG: hypothetical protein Q9204_003866 [Flavoplaca sp. TL-2023a]